MEKQTTIGVDLAVAQWLLDRERVLDDLEILITTFFKVHKNTTGDERRTGCFHVELSLPKVERDQVLNAVKSQGYYCCTAPFGEHEPTCKNYVTPDNCAECGVPLLIHRHPRAVFNHEFKSKVETEIPKAKIHIRPRAPEPVICPQCSGPLVQTAHGPYCPKLTCKWGWETEMDGSPLKAPETQECTRGGGKQVDSGTSYDDMDMGYRQTHNH